jgi:hypothetical protein
MTMNRERWMLLVGVVVVVLLVWAFWTMNANENWCQAHQPYGLTGKDFQRYENTCTN